MTYIPPFVPSLTAFGEQRVANLHPRFQLIFSHPHINASEISSSHTANANAYQSGSMLHAEAQAANSSCTCESHRRLQYNAGQGGLIRYTAGFTSGVAGSMQLAGLGNSVNGLFFGFSGSNFGILHRSASYDTWISQSSWSDDPCDGSGLPVLDHTKLNVYQINYQYLGAGQINFSVEDRESGQLELVHKIMAAGAVQGPTLSHPTMPFKLYAENWSNNTPVRCRTASVGAFIEGQEIVELGHTFSVANASSSISTTWVPLLSVRTNVTMSLSGSHMVHGFSNPRMLTLASNGNRIIQFRLLKNATLSGGGATAWFNVSDSESISAYNTGSTGVTGGTPCLEVPLGTADSKIIELDRIIDDLTPGEVITVAARVDSVGTSSGSAGLIWTEHI